MVVDNLLFRVGVDPGEPHADASAWAIRVVRPPRRRTTRPADSSPISSLMPNDSPPLMTPAITPGAGPASKEEGDVVRFTDALRERGLSFTVEGRGRIALLQPHVSAAPEIDPATRRLIVQLARDAGFSNVALEL